MRLALLILAVCAALALGVSCGDQGGAARIALSAADSMTLVIDHPGWGEHFTYLVPEYAFLTALRGDFRAGAPVGGGDSIVFAGRAIRPQPGSYEFRFAVNGDAIDITATATNRARHVWNPATQCVLCLKCAQAETMTDPLRLRTFVVVGGELVAVGKLPAHASHAAHAVDEKYLQFMPAGVVEKYYQYGAVDNSLIVRSSSDGKRHLAVAWEDAVNVSYNFDPTYQCIHSEPRFAAVRPNESLTLRGKIYLLDGTRQDLVAKFNADFPEQRIPTAE